MSETSFLSYLVILLVGYSMGSTIVGGKNNRSDVIVAPPESVEGQGSYKGILIVSLIVIGLLALIIYQSSSI